ncbi:hypothetical protein Bpfe_019861 [Biomphalaria pfeifferi]|uniref:Uncharacterized protein n=1 Tax=Biomphalaria pfeifferi TaxID=112525 RepID=A0AAD8BAN8_BIOPF|nr:hypothetical protein Bpfe_019861 [Biomphalaria pfeifferi]
MEMLKGAYSSAFKAVVESKPNGDKVITKLDSINHAHEHMGTALQKLAKESHLGVRRVGRSSAYLYLEVAHKLIPIYRRMSDESLLQGMAHSGTQNNESLSLNDMIWARCPKTSFMRLGRVKGSVARAVSIFHAGANELIKPLDVSFFALLKREWQRLLECHKVKHPSSTSLDKKMFPAMLGSPIDGMGMRAGTGRSNTRKKIHVPPGKSISVEELDASSDTSRQQSTPSVEPVTQVVPVDEIQSTSTGIYSSHASSEEIITDSDNEWLPPRQKKKKC